MRFTLLFISLFSFLPAFSQQEKPVLVVGIIVDQMRQDYILRYQKNFAEDGFNRMIREGFMYKNAHFNYVPTSTAPGHTSVYTGSTPAIHGVIGNSWFDQHLNEDVYCAFDSTAQSVGTDNNNGKMSPHRLITPTITDQLRMSSQMRSKVVGISLKDRGAIFPAGFLGKAYWYDASNGVFISSSYYHSTLPDWVDSFNKRRLPDSYKKETWKPVMNLTEYTASGPDESPYEQGLNGKTTFPYNLNETDGYGIISSTPFGNDLVTELAIAALKGEKLGKGEETDFLAVSYSSPDYIGHNFGPNSVEVEDTYLRLDRNIATLLRTLDSELGKGRYVVFLTSDHGVAEVPKRLMDLHSGAGYMRDNIPQIINEHLKTKFGHDNWVRASSNMQIFLNRDLILEAGKDLENVRREVAYKLLQLRGIAACYTYEDMINTPYNESGIKGDLRRGFNQKRSGDVLFVMEPGWLQSGRDTGSSHGTPYLYDTHVPILWYGGNIPAGSSVKHQTVTDIVPTLSMMLNIMLPGSVTGSPMLEVLSTD
jgi:predicted AlkP superfamily pyrophosphatase or phosphodiesterase